MFAFSLFFSKKKPMNIKSTKASPKEKWPLAQIRETLIGFDSKTAFAFGGVFFSVWILGICIVRSMFLRGHVTGSWSWRKSLYSGALAARRAARRNPMPIKERKGNP